MRTREEKKGRNASYWIICSEILDKRWRGEKKQTSPECAELRMCSFCQMLIKQLYRRKNNNNTKQTKPTNQHRPPHKNNKPKPCYAVAFPALQEWIAASQHEQERVLITQTEFSFQLQKEKKNVYELLWAAGRVQNFPPDLPWTIYLLSTGSN